MEPVVKIEQLSKVFKGKKAVNNVSFSIYQGEVVAILGPNGAGKTTTILMMLGLLNPTVGSARLFGNDTKAKEVRERIGVMLQEVSLMDGLKVKEILRLFRSYYPNPLPLETLMDMTGLEETDLKKRVEKLSGGQKRRVGFSLALAGNPDLLFFDEPTVGMDVTARKAFWENILELKKQGKTILFSTHYLQEADDIADRIILFQNGSIMADGNPGDMKRQLTKQSVSFITKERIPKNFFLQESFVSDCFEQDGRMVILTNDTDAVLAKIYTQQLEVKDIRVERGRLEEAFEQLMNQGKQGEVV
ncbi:ABC transporter ATP-binding protein [Lederbergia galactosidilytica]|uniref:ABC transporter ATP-binding protein n=1 Tax=Lederbergia galactosidilytica TaxID=217031 RepID=A0A178A1F9_9BACI|nr:ABC transporter ATP-binding protein [Lederbergia galactosidilytica]KRG16151.1 ABC transporter ATP-binding protein [Virgibacillus soli]MBP1914006.1 ABC-2 type transport system ATP-binding protein [Lederbergia galactosidilytica]OAK74027.1 ABC transporter ATP-binding protein [Lederbergia galactosidilytica]